jgi:hypothetical protein
MSKNLLRSIADLAKQVDLECPVVALLISLRDIFEAIRKAYVASPVSRRYQKDLEPYNHLRDGCTRVDGPQRRL